MSFGTPLASLSLDLDNKWSYLKTHGDPEWETFPSYLDVVVPRFLDFLARRGLKITVFIVGQDADRPEHHAILRSIADDGHEIGNHSFSHEPWLHRYSHEQTEREIAFAEERIEAATGVRPRGFRGPGFSISAATLEILAERGYAYDASTLPTFIGPLARAYYFMTARLSREELRRREALFGSIRDGLRPLRPYRWRTAGRELVEIPVTTMPLLRIPIHVSYVVYLATFSRVLARSYFRAALSACQLAGQQPSILLHPLDFLGCDDVDGLEFFPGMRMNRAEKLAIVDEVLTELGSRFAIVPMRVHAAAVAASRTALVPLPKAV